MLTLVTGVPGGGKSLWMVDRIATEREKTNPRPVYVQGVDGLKMDVLGVEPIDVREWHLPGVVPDGSLIFVDEAWKDDCFPQRMAGKPVPDHVVALRESRHRGIDFVIATQNPKQIEVEVRRLIGRHLHLENLFGTKASQIYEWAKLVDRPTDDRGARSGAIKKTWPHPKGRYELYESASAHEGDNNRVRVPWKILAIPVLLLVLVGLIWLGMSTLDGLTDAPVEGKARAAESKPVAVGGGLMQPLAGALSRPAQSLMGRQERSRGTRDEYVASLVPRVASQPWSAPIFDQKSVVAEPEIYCASVQDGPCICHTEQGTRYRLKDRECRIVAKVGQYNPYRRPPSERDSSRFPADREDRSLADGAGLKAGAEVGKSGRTVWPRPDFRYQVPFPKVSSDD